MKNVRGPFTKPTKSEMHFKTVPFKFTTVRLPLQNTVTKAYFRKRLDERKGAH